MRLKYLEFVQAWANYVMFLLMLKCTAVKPLVILCTAPSDIMKNGHTCASIALSTLMNE